MIRSLTTLGVVSFITGALLIPSCQRKSDEPGPTTRDGRVSPLLSNLGNLHRAVTTGDKMAQRYFDQGLTLIYGFNHAEAARSFKEAARVDPDLAMAYWGQALAVAPNINDSVLNTEREKEAYQASQQAVQRKAKATEVEQALIDALAQRFTAAEKPDRKALNVVYADAMAKVYERFPDDPEVATLYADAVMNTMPWDYWTKDGKPKPGVERAVAALESVIRRHPDHPGAHHLYIHALEASPDPDRAMPSADRLGALVPGAGHLVHMPAHIYIRVGRYADASAANVRAIAADEDYITQCRAQGIYPAAYYPHNIHFLTATLAMEGRSKDMLEAADKVGKHHGDETLKEPGFGFPHLLRAIPLLGRVRFGRWDEVLALAEPHHDAAFVRAMWHYARGMAHSAKSDPKAASAELAKLRSIAADPALEELKIFDLNSLAALARIAAEVLEGEVEARRKNYAAAVRHLQKAIELEEGLLYSEPPDWPNPPRHNLGAVLLAAGRAAGAEKVYREDLTRHRNNGWALYGLAQSLDAQGKMKEAEETRRRLQDSWTRADVKLTASRF